MTGQEAQAAQAVMSDVPGLRDLAFDRFTLHASGDIGFFRPFVRAKVFFNIKKDDRQFNLYCVTPCRYLKMTTHLSPFKIECNSNV